MNQTEKQLREMEVSDPWAGFIFTGQKKVEVRKNNPNSWGSVKTGDVLRIKNRRTQEKRLFDVVKCRTYESLNDCIIAEGVRNLLPGKETLGYARKIYLGFDGDDEESMRKREAEYNEFGCIAIELTPHVPEQRMIIRADGLREYVDVDPEETESVYKYTPEQIEKKVQEIVNGPRPSEMKERSGHANYSKVSHQIECPLGTKKIWFKCLFDVPMSRTAGLVEIPFPPGCTNVEFGFIEEVIEDPRYVRVDGKQVALDDVSPLVRGVLGAGIHGSVDGMIDLNPIQKPHSKGKKDKTEKPKGTISAYMFYGSQRRPQLKYEEPDLSFGELTKTIAAEWNAMPEDQKAPFHQLASADRERYRREKAEQEREARKEVDEDMMAMVLQPGKEKIPIRSPDNMMGDMRSSPPSQMGMIASEIVEPYYDHEQHGTFLKMPTELQIQQSIGRIARAPESVEDRNRKVEETRKAIQTHINGSSRPEGDPNCKHQHPNGKTAVEYNDDTMGGMGSRWEKMCPLCGKVWND